ncbi:MAG TPA: thiamine pyrophosphate-binding protein, partial [Acidobacteriota bacterium]|nr:thiamine pyrophosphate-binding protein [Acidobacteriota bacterium]
GASNTITALADAHRDNVPLLVVTGQVGTSARNTDAFQELNITEIAAPVVKKAFYLSRPDEIVETVCTAFRTAREGRPGPVLIDFTKDAQQAVVYSGEIAALTPAASLPRESSTIDIPESSLDEVARLLSRASRPAIIAGYGLILAKAQKALRELLEIVPCPVVHTLPGKAALDSSHPRNFGLLGMHGFYVANWIINRADLIISLGARYDDRITGDLKSFAPRAVRLVHFDIDPAQISKVLPERKLGVVGDLKHTLTALIRRLEGSQFDLSSWQAEIAAIKETHPSTYKRKSDVLQAQQVIEVLSEVIDKTRPDREQPVIFTTEVGDHQMWAAQFLQVRDNWHFITTSGQGAMGAGLPMAIGAQLAYPNALVVCLAGDGSLRMSEAELETVTEQQSPLKIILFNNQGYGIVRMWNDFFYEGRRTGVVKCHKNWTLLAQANGFSESRVQTVCQPAQLRKVLESALCQSGPCFVEMVTPYEECLPLLPPGKRFEDVIL